MARPTALALLLALSGAAVACGGEDVTYRRREGEVLTCLRTLELESRNPAGNEGRVRQEVTTRETAVEVIPRERMTTEVLIERVVIEVFRGGKDPVVRMDSKEEPGPSPAAPGAGKAAERFEAFVRPLRHLAGSRVEVSQRPSGIIVKIDGVDALRDRLLAAIPEGDPTRPVAEKMSWGFWLTNLCRPAVTVPERPASTGVDSEFLDMRTLPETVGVQGFAYFRGKYRLAEVKDGVARLTMEGEASLDPAPRQQPWRPEWVPGRNRLRLQRGVCRGWARIRVEDGRLLEDEHVTDLDLRFVRPDGSGEVPIPQKVTQRTKLVE